MAIQFQPGTSQSIRSVQTYLRRIAQSDPDIPKVIPDGKYGKQTQDAVLAFQKKYGIKPTGEVDRESWDKILLVYNSIIEYEGEPLPANIYPNSKYTIMPEQKSETLLVIQSMILAISRRYSNITAVRVTGIHYENSVEAVKQLQQVFDLEPTGIIDKTFWNHLVRLYETIVSKTGL